MKIERDFQVIREVKTCQSYNKEIQPNGDFSKHRKSIITDSLPF